MSASSQDRSDAGWRENGRPQSTLARDFSAALDDLFKLNGIGALEESVFQKQGTVQSQRYKLEDLDAKLREADAKLKTLEAKHRRHQSQMLDMRTIAHQNRSTISPAFGPDQDDSGDSDGQGRSSPVGEERAT